MVEPETEPEPDPDPFFSSTDLELPNKFRTRTEPGGNEVENLQAKHAVEDQYLGQSNCYWNSLN